MEYLKVKGWDFYNSIGKKVTEPKKEQVRVLISTLSEGDLFSIELGGEVYVLSRIYDDCNYMYLSLKDSLLGAMCGDARIYKVENCF